MATYEEWINFLFNRNEMKGEWRFNMDIDDFSISPESVVEFTERMFVNCEIDLSPFTDWQVAMGISFVFNNSFSDYAFYLRDEPTPITKRLSSINSLKFFI